MLHAGTASKDGQYVATGGRVLNALGHGETLEAAVANAYAVLDGIELEGSFSRSDIARPAIDGTITIPEP